MENFKFTCWNVEHADKLLTTLDEGSADKKRKAEMRMDAIAEEIAALDADILLISEGPHGALRAQTFFDRVAPDYTLVVRDEATSDAYGMKGGAGFAGRQWLWFLIRKERPITGQLLHLDQWMALTSATAGEDYKDRYDRWQVSFPEMKKNTAGEDILNFKIGGNHEHWRHPQVLMAEIDGAFVEFIGCHLKSKFNNVRTVGAASDADFFDNNPKLVAELIKARVKISTEATDIRHYIEARFAADASSAIVVAGDLNDGPGKERIERRFLYHDLIGALQGNVFFSQRFLNHALFDAPSSERWSVFFEDALDPGRNPHILLDHILFSQSMTGSRVGTPSLFRARSGGGLVEHEVHHRVTSTRYKYAMTSDHRPVSMWFDKRDPEGIETPVLAV